MYRSKRYKTNIASVEKGKIYPLDEAIDLLKKARAAKFQETVEVHFSLNINPGKTEQQVRSGVDLPHGTGKKVKVAVFTDNQSLAAAAEKAGAEIVGGESLIEKIQTAKSLDVEATVATPDMMPKLAKIAKILGPRGLMPNPKNETVTQDVAKAVTMLKKGKVNFKNDKSGNVHIPLGKISFDAANIKENYEVSKKALEKAKPKGIKGKFIRSIIMSTTMGVGVKIG